MKKGISVILSIIMLLSVFSPCLAANAIKLPSAGTKNTDKVKPDCAEIASSLVIPTSLKADVTLDKESYKYGDEIKIDLNVQNNTGKQLDTFIVKNKMSHRSMTIKNGTDFRQTILADGESFTKTMTAYRVSTGFAKSMLYYAENILEEFILIFYKVLSKLPGSRIICASDLEYFTYDGTPTYMHTYVFAFVSDEIDEPDEPDEPIEPEETIDNDSDGLSENLENLLGISDTENDSDNDGIDDYVEIYEIGSDPAVSDSDDDYDNDGISNIDEVNTYNTSPSKADTDADGISDYEEIFKCKTNPSVYDTDGDGVGDGDELILGTDPLTKQTSFEITLSADEDNDSVKPSVEIELNGSQVGTLDIEKYDNDTIFPETMPGYMGEAYDFSVDGDFDKAKISFEFDPDAVSEKSEPTIYYFNEKTQELEALDTTVNGNVASAEVEHFSKYILIDRTIYEESFSWTDVWDSTKNYTNVEIMLVIDDSGSLGGDYGYNSSTGMFTGGMDPEHKRLEVARNFVDKANNSSKIGIVKFDSSIVNMTNGLIECNADGKSLLKDKLKFTYGNSSGFDSKGSTYMYGGIESAITQFSSSNESTLKVIIVFTDGQAQDSSKHNSVVNKALANDIKIYTVGLGNNTSYFNNYLKPLAVNTAGVFFLASNADQLSEIYDTISQKIDIETDSDDDGIPDYYEDNMIIFSGVKLNLDKNNPDTDGDGLKDGEEVELKYEYNADRTQVKVTGKFVLGSPMSPDTDYDGISDDKDALPMENTFTGSLRMSGTSPKISYTFDYRNFFKNSSTFNSTLSQTSLIFSSVMYENGKMDYDDRFGLTDTQWNEKIISYHMDDVINYHLDKGFKNEKVNFKSYNDDDISEVVFGHKKVEYNGVTKEIIGVFVRGTNGTIEEWSSNFDIGNLDKFDSYSDWANSQNHKGFDVASTRIIKALYDYVSKYVSNVQTTYWVTGHSRGAAIANIISAELIDDGNEVFAYTFATPNTTIATNANSSKYNSIFNILNKNDFVTCVPMADWEFTRYGRSTYNETINSKKEKEWEAFTGEGDYNPISQKTLDKLVAELASCSKDGWKSCHLYTCDCHGDKSDNSIVERGVEPKIYEGIIKYTRPGKYCMATEYKRLNVQKQYQLCQIPAYFMQVLAEIMVEQYSLGLGGYLEQLTEIVSIYSLADKYESARTQVVLAAAKGIAHQHYTETYYIINQSLTQGSFK